MADGLEHKPLGTPSSQTEDHQAQLDKRARKLLLHEYGEHWAEVEGEGAIAIVTWGSSTGPAREAIAMAAADGMKVRLVSLRLLAPAQTRHFAEALEGVDKVLVVEQSHSRQFYHYLRAHFDLPDVDAVHPDAAAAQAAAFGLAARMVCDGYVPQDNETYQNSLSAPVFRVVAGPAVVDDPDEAVNERGWWHLRPEGDDVG